MDISVDEHIAQLKDKLAAPLPNGQMRTLGDVLDAKALLQLRDARLKAGQGQLDQRDENPRKCPPDVADPFPEAAANIPEIHARDLNLDILNGAMRHHGALIIRGMMEASETAAFRDMIDRVISSGHEHFRGQRDGTTALEELGAVEAALGDEWFSPTRASLDDGQIKRGIEFMLDTGSIWTFVSPRLSYELTSFFERAGVRDLFQNYFGDDPMFTFKKSVLRRVEPLTWPSDWHQDGAFMGADINSLNIWIALSDCGSGQEAPGMDFVPKRLREIVATGTEGAAYEWSVSSHLVEEDFKDFPVVEPVYAAGDGIIFDHFNLHRTSYNAEFSKPRYAIETWFFAQNYGPGNQVPIIW